MPNSIIMNVAINFFSENMTSGEVDKISTKLSTYQVWNFMGKTLLSD